MFSVMSISARGRNPSSGMRPNEPGNDSVLRVAHARELLLYSDRSVLDIAVATGFSSTSHFSHWFKQAYGYRPTEFRKTLPARWSLAHK